MPEVIDRKLRADCELAGEPGGQLAEAATDEEDEVAFFSLPDEVLAGLAAESPDELVPESELPDEELSEDEPLAALAAASLPSLPAGTVLEPFRLSVR